MIGQTISHYAILDKLGEGGMGVIYQARDTSLERIVALKFLAPHLVSNSEVRKRFIREAKTAAALQHPNICTVFEIGESDGHTFIAMTCLEGHELADEIAQGPLNAGRALDLATQFAEGLAEAHSKGIVHRDIKPANLFVTSSGRGVILDFGLAQLASADSKLTREGSTLGTCAYMSPEQATGADVDARTDVWALGCVLYEMLAGHPPFRGHYDQAIIYSILNEQPEPLGSSARGLEPVITRCLDKRSDARYRDAADLRDALRTAGGHAGRREPASTEPPHKSRDDDEAKIPSVAVLPFENRSRDEDDEYFSDGVAEDIITTLAKIQGLRVTPRSSAFRLKGQDLPPSEIAARLNVENILTCSVRKAGNRLRVTAELVRAKDEAQLWAERFDRVLEDIFEIQDEISAAIASELEAKLALAPSGGTPTTTARRSPDLEAYRCFLQGRRYNTPQESDTAKAISSFDRALAIDPDYLEARAGRATALSIRGLMGWESPQVASEAARQEARRVIAADPTIGEAHTALGNAQYWFDWDCTSAERSYREAIACAPSDPMPHMWLAHLLGDTGRISEALGEARIAVEMDPLYAFVNRTLGYLVQYDRRFEEGVDLSRKTLELDPNHVPAMWAMASALFHLGRFGEMNGILERALALAPDSSVNIGICAMWWGGAGERDQAMEQLRKLEHLRNERRCGAFPFWCAYAGLGDFDCAAEWLETARIERDGLVAIFRSFPWPHNDVIQSDPRFLDIWTRTGIPDSTPKPIRDRTSPS